MKKISSIILFFGLNQLLLCQSTDQNFVKTRTMLNEAGTQYLDQIVYFDGLGRPVQTVQRGITPDGKDLVTYQTYDAFGREEKSYLPRKSGNANGNFVSQSAFNALSTSIHKNDAKPYTQTVYENSPLNRVTAQYGAGEAWNISPETRGGHPVKTDYLTNTASGEQVCAYYYMSGDNLVKSSNNYTAGQLFVTRITDEDGNKSYEFKDKLGRVLLTRQMNGTTPHDTYYVYDDFGNTRFVLSPKGTDGLTSNITYNSDTHATLKTLCYTYRYDSRNRMIYKRLPGAEPIYYVYDKADHLILSQDGEQRYFNKWLVMKYDRLGRLIYTGFIHRNIGESEKDIIRNNVVTESYVGETQSNTVAGYTCTYFINEVSLLTANYYDNYDFMGKNGIPNTVYLQYETVSNYGVKYDNAKGLLTGTFVNNYVGEQNVTVPSAYKANVTTILYYDDKGQVIQTKKNFYSGSYEKEYIACNFTGQPIRRKTAFTWLPTAGTGVAETVTEEYSYSYDHAGRLVNTKHKLNGGTERSLAANTYDDLGRLETTKANNAMMLELNYTYNVRGWLQEIWGPYFFSESLYYEDGDIWNATPRYNGNISTAYRGGQIFNYSYDNLNRLTKTQNSFDDWTMSGNYSSAFKYDKNGNISDMFRQDVYEIEDIGMSYSGNQKTSLWYIFDNYYDSYEQEVFGYYGLEISSTLPYGTFADYTHGAGGTFTYNRNGSLTHDPYKKVNYTYNLLGMPKTVTVPAVNGSITYKYDATGNKLETVYKWHSGLSLDPVENTGKNYTGTNSTKTVQYYGNKIYENGALKMILLPNGYIKNNQYYFYLKDHLGNNAVVCDANGNVVQETYYHPYGKPIKHYSTAANVQPFKYNGKEQETMMGLEQYDLGNRTLDYTYDQFTTMDRFAEKTPWQSPYVVAAGNPVNYVDVNGDSISTKEMTAEEQTAYSTQIGDLRKGSKLFDTYYSSLESSTNWYNVKYGETSLDDGGERVPGQFVPDKNGGGYITFRKGTELIPINVAEEMYHAYQNDNGTLNTLAGQNSEFEAKTAALLTVIESRSVYALPYGFTLEYEKSLYQSSYKNMHSFSEAYFINANKFADYCRKTSNGNSYYNTPQVSLMPITLRRLLQSDNLFKPF